MRLTTNSSFDTDQAGSRSADSWLPASGGDVPGVAETCAGRPPWLGHLSIFPTRS